MERIRLGVLTPSSNTVLEPMTTAMLSAYTQVTAHFSRTKVSEISLQEKSQSRFDVAHFLPGAELLADARVHVIAWSGTSAGWRGFEADQALCRLIEQRTGVVATTSVVALNEIFRITGVRRFGLVTPYLNDIQRRIIDNYENAGFECVAEKHLDDPGNFSFADVSEKVIGDMVRRIAREKPDAITIFCTNLRGAHLVAELEREIDIPIYDTVATALWHSLRLVGVDTSRIKGWGQLFSVTQTGQAAAS